MDRNVNPTNDYLTYLLNLPNITPIGLLSLFFLGLFRIAPIVSLAPFLGAKLPGGVKMGLAISLTLIFLPQLVHNTPVPIEFGVEFIGLSLKELFIGIILAFLASIPFYIAQSSGSLIDFMRGSSSLQVPDPLTQSQTSPIGILFNYMLVVIFFQLNGHLIFLDSLTESFRILPVGKGLSSFFFNANLPFWKTIAGLLTRVTAITMQLAAPSIVSILMAEMFLGIANRLAPQVQIVFLGMSLKSLLGLGLLWAGWFFILQQMGNQSIIWLRTIDQFLRTFNM